MFEVALLVIAGLSTWLHPRRVPAWVGPTVCAAVAIAARSVSVADARTATDALRSPLLFLAFAVPLAVALGEIGVFAALARWFDSSRRPVASLWVLAALVVIVFNLDAAVVLLTPLYIQIARRRGLDTEALAFQPALLACLASGVLPVSNLTNLVVAARFDLDAGDFLANLALPSLVATAVGFVAYRAVFPVGPAAVGHDDVVDGRALRRGLPIIVFVVAGFVLGDLAGIPAWAVAAVATGWACSYTRRIPIDEVPLGAIVMVASLAVVVAAATPHLDLAGLLGGTDAVGRATSVGVATALSNLVNNLPTTLAGASAISDPSMAWPLLIGTNIGSIFLVSGSLSTILWRSAARSDGLDVTGRRWSSVAVRIGVPALVASTVMSLLTTR